MTTPDRLAEHYERRRVLEGDSWRRVEAPASRVPRERIDAFRRGFPRLFRGGDILELGAGSGRATQSMIDLGLDYSSYTVSELVPARVEQLEERFAQPNIRAVQLDANDLPDLTSQFDAVVMIALIEHLVDPIDALARVRKLLRPGGFVWIDTPNVAKYTRRIKLAAGYFPSTSARDEGLTTFEGAPVNLLNEGHLHYFTYRSLTRMLLERCGFDRIEQVPYTNGFRLISPRVDHVLAKRWPGLFAEICIAAFAA